VYLAAYEIPNGLKGQVLLLIGQYERLFIYQSYHITELADIAVVGPVTLPYQTMNHTLICCDPMKILINNKTLE